MKKQLIIPQMIKDAQTLTLAVRPCFCIAYVIGRLNLIKMNISVLISKFSTDELIALKKVVDKYLKIKLRESDTRIDYLDISVRAMNVLRFNQISTLEELSKMTPSDFMKLRNMGKKTFVEMTEVLSLHGLSWKS